MYIKIWFSQKKRFFLIMKKIKNIEDLSILMDLVGVSENDKIRDLRFSQVKQFHIDYLINKINYDVEIG